MFRLTSLRIATLAVMSALSAGTASAQNNGRQPGVILTLLEGQHPGPTDATYRVLRGGDRDRVLRMMRILGGQVVCHRERNANGDVIALWVRDAVVIQEGNDREGPGSGVNFGAAYRIPVENYMNGFRVLPPMITRYNQWQQRRDWFFYNVGLNSPEVLEANAEMQRIQAWWDEALFNIFRG